MPVLHLHKVYLTFIMLRFQNHRVAPVGDIENAFLMVHMHETDKDVLRFLWVDDIDKAQPKVGQSCYTEVYTCCVWTFFQPIFTECHN